MIVWRGGEKSLVFVLLRESFLVKCSIISYIFVSKPFKDCHKIGYKL